MATSDLHPDDREVVLPGGAFRMLEWRGKGPAAFFLHGLTGVADVWGPTVAALGANRLRCLAIDQRGHGQSIQGDIDYRIGAFVRDLEAFIDAMDLGRVHLVGHSMGARVAMVAAARRPKRYHSVAIVDIGPEQWRENWVSSTEAFTNMPSGFESEADAVSFASRSRPLTGDARDIFLARLKPSNGGLAWRADIEGLKAIVKLQRSRNYWREWRRLGENAVLIRGERSNELRPYVAEAMRSRNPAVGFAEIPGAPHNIPLADPGALAEVLGAHWRRWLPDSD